MKKNTSDSTPKPTLRQRLTSLFVLALILSVGGVVLWQNNVYGILNPGLTFNVLSEKESDNFDAALAFAYDSHFSDTDTDGVQKWMEPMRIKVEGDPSDKDLKALNDIIDAFNSIDGFPGMQLVSSDENVRIIYTTKDNFERIRSQNIGNHGGGGDKSFCRSFIRNGEIAQSIIVIEPDKPSQGYRNTVVLHEMFHAVGFYLHVSDRASIMTEKGPVPGLSKTDTLALKMMYNPDVPIGMTYSDFAEYYGSMTVEDFLNK